MGGPFRKRILLAECAMVTTTQLIGSLGIIIICSKICSNQKQGGRCNRKGFTIAIVFGNLTRLVLFLKNHLHSRTISNQMICYMGTGFRED